MPVSRTPRRQTVPRVLICLNPAAEFPRQVAMGVSEYSHRHGPWDMGLVSQSPVTADALLPYPDATGIIAMAYEAEARSVLERTGVPIVLAQDDDNGNLPRVGPNDPIVGRMALDSFRTKGFKRVAYCGPIAAPASRQRRDAFRNEAERSGLDFYVYDGTVFSGIERFPDLRDQLYRWLTDLPKPIGLLVFCDQIAVTVLHFCRSRGIIVPEEIAVLGVDNDALLCDLTSPRISSIDHGARRIGYEAAALLDHLMRGQAPPPKPILMDPIGIVERQSANTMAVDHPDLAAALTFIRQHAQDHIHVPDVLHAVPLSRRALERGFQRTLGRTVHQEILRVRVEAAKHLLLSTNIALPDISRRCGFSYSTKLSEIFKRLTGFSPRQFRQKYHVGDGTQHPQDTDTHTRSR